MESKVINLYDYHKVDLSAFAIKFDVDEGAIERDIEMIQNRESKWEEGENVCKSDIAVCCLSSELPQFNKEKAKVVVGCNLLNKDLEAALVGMKKGECKVVTINDKKVMVNITDIMHRIAPVFDDTMAKKQGIEGVETVEDYRSYLIAQQKEKAVEKVSYEAIQTVINEVINKSDVAIKKNEWIAAINLELSKYKALAELQGYELEKMKGKDFDGKIPVQSYHELLAMTQVNNWDSLAQYLIGKIFAEKDGYCPDERSYDKFIKEYAEYWHDTEEDAKKINSYDYYMYTSYTGYFYKTIKDYAIESILKKEE